MTSLWFIVLVLPSQRGGDHDIDVTVDRVAAVRDAEVGGAYWYDTAIIPMYTQLMG